MHVVSAALLLAGALLAYHATRRTCWPPTPWPPPAIRGFRNAAGAASCRTFSPGRTWDRVRNRFSLRFSLRTNLKVGLVAMGLGVLAGVPTVLLMLYNGMILGAFVSVYMKAGLGAEILGMDTASWHHRTDCDRPLRRCGAACWPRGHQPRAQNAAEALVRCRHPKRREP